MSKKKIFTIIYIFTFLIGGVFQYLGIVSYTLLTMVLVVLMGLSLLIHKSSIIIKIPYAILTLILVLSLIMNHSSLILGIYYFVVFIITPFVCFLFIWSCRDFLDSRRIYKLILTVAVVQLPVLIIQIIFSEAIAGGSGGRVSAHDAAFGTFFLSNDHGLGFFLLCLITYILYKKDKSKKNILLILYLSLTIFICNSNVSFALLVFVFIMYGLHRSKNKMFKYGCYLCVLLVLCIGVYSISPAFQEKVDSMINKTINKEADDYEKWIERGEADRFHILNYFLNEDFKVIGDGPYNYYDPIEKTFTKFGNFSQYLWLYNDLGILGMFAMIVIYWKQAKVNNNRMYRYTFLGLILIFSFFTNTLSDLATNISFSIFLMKNE